MRSTVLQAYIDDIVEKFPQKVAIKDIKGEYTFKQLYSLSQKVATYLISQNQYNKPVPVFIPKSKEAVATFTGINMAGCFYVPIDTKSPLNRITAIFDSLDASIIITTKDLKPVFANYSYNVICFEDIVQEIEVDREAIKLSVSKVIDTDPVYSIFTSGSTGLPKGVVVSHRGLIDYIDWVIETFNVDEKAIIGNQSPFYFDVSATDIYLMYAKGATLVIVPDEYYIFPAQLIDFLNENKVNQIFWVPFALMNVANLDIFKEKPLLYVDKVLFAGEVMPNKQLNYWRKYLPNALFANLYGPTEITVIATYYIVNREFADNEPLPIGIQCANTHALILNDTNKECTEGERGELCIRGSGLALGYYNDRTKTDSVFVQNPLHDLYNDLIYRTGDLVYKNELGEIIFVGRKDSQIKHNGYRIELGEIENAAMMTELIQNACAMYDNINKRIILFYQSEVECKPVEMRKSLLNFIPKYMVPARFIQKEAFPLTSNGKINRLKLQEEINA